MRHDEMPCGHVPIHYLTPHPTPGLAVSVCACSVRSRVVLGRAMARRTYVLCCAVMCAVRVSNGVFADRRRDETRDETRRDETRDGDETRRDEMRRDEMR